MERNAHHDISKLTISKHQIDRYKYEQTFEERHWHTNPIRNDFIKLSIDKSAPQWSQSFTAYTISKKTIW